MLTKRSKLMVFCRPVCVSSLVMTLLIHCGWIGTSAVAQLPPESQLPGTPARAAQLPGEEALPGDRPANAQLPGEDQIPGQAPPQVQGKPPILRLAFDGHTGIIRTLDISDGGRTLVTAGEDKDLHVWRRSDISDSGWLHRQTIRWPVTRGPRGLIYSARLKGDLVAFAGYGAFGSKGEIRIVDVLSKDLQTLVDYQNGHLSNVLSLAWAPQPQPRLASVDMEGRLLIWQRDPNSGIWGARTLVNVDSQTYNAEVAASLKLVERRAFVPVAFLGTSDVVVPRFVGATTEPKGFANWHLQRIDLQTGKSDLITDLDHVRHVRALSARADGKVLASCDWDGSIGIWNFDGDDEKFAKFKPSAPPIFVDLSDDGKRLLVGTELVSDKNKATLQAKLQLWDVAASPPQLLSERPMDDNVRTGVIDEQHGQAIVAQGIHVEIHSFDAEGKFSKNDAKQLTVPARPVRKVAFAKAGDGYKIAFGWNADQQGEIQLEGVFDLSQSKLLGRAPIDPADFSEPQRTATRWQYAGPVQTPNGFRLQLLEAGQPRGVMPLGLDRHGWPTTICTLPVEAAGNEDPKANRVTGAVIVGTSGEYGIYAYKANQSNPPELLRQFRDHSGAITSLSTSSDGRYLVSSAGDATISVWNLQDIYTATKSVNRWGADFEVEGDQLMATNVREDGPLYFRGVRSGDRLISIDWVDDNAKPFAQSEPEEMRRLLNELPFDLLIHFKFARLGRLGPDFQSLPAWRPLATLFVDQTREWAFWTPAGYYDASFNGHQRFGWQVNNSVDRQVEYFRAAQFRKLLERSDVMRRLLAAGSLPAAMRQTVSQIGPPPAEGAIVNQIQSKPKIRLLSPDPRDVIEGDSLTMRAAIEVPTGATLVDPKAFVSGVPAISRRMVSDREGDASNSGGSRTVTYEWQFRLPSDKQLQLEVLAATEAEAIDRVLVDLERKPSDRPPVKPRLHVLAIGASQYRDPQIQSLDFAAEAAGRMVELFRTRSAKIYQTSGDELVDSDATRPLWRVFAQSAAEKLRQTVSPDDLVIMYLCGHGLRDRRTNQWYFVTSDARYSDLMNDQYGDCIAFSDLAALSSLPCRKLAILDSCHSGAVQPLMQRDDLKSALRFLQDDVVLTMTASEGDEEAAEQRAKRMGRFTAALVSALGGEAPELDGDAATVSLAEAIDYVSRRVAVESEQDQMPQHPTASPDYLLRTLRLPLTSRPNLPLIP